jgi:hypothetical protein
MRRSPVGRFPADGHRHGVTDGAVTSGDIGIDARQHVAHQAMVPGQRHQGMGACAEHHHADAIPCQPLHQTVQYLFE